VCGACAGGGGVPRWEDRLQPATRRVLSARAAAANRLLRGSRLRVTTWGTGYLVGDGRGRSAPAADLDALWRTCRGWGGGLRRPADSDRECAPEPEGAADPTQVPLDGLGGKLALVAVWVAAVAHSAELTSRLHLDLPDPAGDRTLLLDLAPAAVDVQVRHAVQLPAVLSGVGAREIATLLRAACTPTNDVRPVG
jgi:hypothetical protein